MLAGYKIGGCHTLGRKPATYLQNGGCGLIAKFQGFALPPSPDIHHKIVVFMIIGFISWCQSEYFCCILFIGIVFNDILALSGVLHIFLLKQLLGK